METKARCLRAPRNLFLSSLKTHRVVEPTPSKNIRCRTLKPLNINKMKFLENTGLDSKVWERDKSEATTSEEETRDGESSPTAQRRWTACSHSEKLRSLPPGLARVPTAHLVTEKPLAADAEVDEELVAFFNAKHRLGYSRSASGGNVSPLSGVREARGHFLPRSHRSLQGWKHRAPSRSRDPSCVVHMDSADYGRSTAEVHICGQRHGRVVLSLMRELALDCISSQPWKPHGSRLQLQLSRLLGGVEQSDRGDKVRRLYPTTGGIQDTAQRTVH